MFEGLKSLWAGPSRSDVIAGRSMQGADDYLHGLKDDILWGEAPRLTAGIRAVAHGISSQYGAQQSVSDQNRVDRAVADPTIKGYIGLLGAVVDSGLTTPYVDGFHTLGLAVHNVPHAATSLAKGLVNVHDVALANGAQDVAAEVRGVRSRLMGENLHPDCALMVALRAHSFDGRAAGPAQVAGAAGTAPGG